jgi:choline dehydrogenase
MGGGRYTDALSALAHRLAQRTDARILLLEVGGSDLVAGSLIPETWYLNQTGPLVGISAMNLPRASTAARSSTPPDGRSAAAPLSTAWSGHGATAMISRNGRASQAIPPGGYDRALDVSRRIEDWQDEPDPVRRGTGGAVYVEPARNPHPISLAFLKGAHTIGFNIYADQNGILQELDGGAAITNVRIHGLCRWREEYGGFKVDNASG